MKRINLLLALICFACSVTETNAANRNSDMERLRNKFIEELMIIPVNEAQIKTIISTIQPDGTWPGIDYADTSRTGFRHTIHLSNLIQMSRAYKKKDSPLAKNRELKKAIDLGLNHWLQHNYICDNWWNNEIGTPNDLTAVLLIMDTDLSKEQIEKTLAITARSHINAWGARQSGDRIKIAGIQAKNAIFKRDVPTFEMLVKVIEEEVRFVPFEEKGLMHDYSFHHREDKVNNTLSYGLSYAETFVEWADKLADTRYRLSEATIKLLIDYYLDGICKMMVFGRFSDPGAVNRDISRPRGGYNSSPVMAERLMKVSNYRQDELQEIVNLRRNANLKPSRSFDVFYWQSEHYTHQRPSYFTSVRMFSSRNYNMEEPYNGEGLKNHHRGDGTNYLSISGKEYFDIAPVYDWQKIPGTTVMQKPALPSETQIQKAGVMDFVGAATDGNYGVVGFDFISPHDPLRARKAWFFFDSEYVCLGAGIRSNSGMEVATTINQCRLEGDVTAASSGGEAIIDRGERLLDNTSWVFHNGTGYIFPEPTGINLSNQAQTGSWYDINHQTNSSKQIQSIDVFKLWFNHGVRPNQAAYSYIIMPASTVEQVKSAGKNPKVEILSNTPYQQSVWHKELNILQSVFYKNGEITLPNGLKITIDSPGILMIKVENGKINSITVSDPQRNHGRIHVNNIAIDLPQGEYAGKSVTVKL